MQSITGPNCGQLTCLWKGGRVGGGSSVDMVSISLIELDLYWSGFVLTQTTEFKIKLNSFHMCCARWRSDCIPQSACADALSTVLYLSEIHGDSVWWWQFDRKVFLNCADIWICDWMRVQWLISVISCASDTVLQIHNNKRKRSRLANI